MNKANKKVLLLFLLPSMIFAVIFIFYPIINTVLLSFVNPKTGNFTLSNYTYLIFNEPQFHTAIINTFIYTVIVTTIEMLISLFVAYLLSLKIKFKNFFQTIFFLPYVTSVIAIGAVFRYMFHSQYGIINQIIEVTGHQGLNWLTDQRIVLIPVIILGIWKGLAFNILIVFTGLSTTNADLEKAALLDNFSNRQIYTKIKLPQIKPVLIYLLIMNIIFNLKVYEEVIAMFPTGGVGADSSATLVYILQNKTITDTSLAACIAVLLLVFAVGIRVLSKLIGRVRIRRRI